MPFTRLFRRRRHGRHVAGVGDAQAPVRSLLRQLALTGDARAKVLAVVHGTHGRWPECHVGHWRDAAASFATQPECQLGIFIQPDHCGTPVSRDPAVYPQPSTSPAVKLIIVARQEAGKGTDTVIRSLPRLAQRFPAITFEIVGDGSAIPELERLAHECGVADRVHFTGKVDHGEVLQRLRASTMFVFPTASEGFPKAVLEGLACGLPLIATRVSVLPNLLANGCGVLLDEASPDAVARAVEQVLADSTGYETMSRQAIGAAGQYSLESWRDTVRAHLTRAWGPLKAGAR